MMKVMFKGHKSGFNVTGSNEAIPNEMGPPMTKFMGRGGLPEGPLKRYPGAVADIDDGNRRLAKTQHGEGMDDGVRFTGAPNGFSTHRGSKAKSPGMRGRSAMKDNKK